MTFSIVVPTLARPSLARLLDSLAACSGPLPERIVLVDDRRGLPQPLLAERAAPGWTDGLVTVLRSGGRGPAAARNVGWHAVDSMWVVFLDDDVEVTPPWLLMLNRDVGTAPDVGASQGRIVVPQPAHRRPTDWERGTEGLSRARWITADMAYRRSVLAAVGGFDERFPGAFREDADLALRVIDAGYRILDGQRITRHSVRPARWNVSLKQQRGNADDALMRRLHGTGWHRRAHAGVGRRPCHLVTTAAGLVALIAGALRRRPPALVAGLAWATLTAEFAWSRIKPGPGDLTEVSAMVATSVAIPPAATWHWLRGVYLHRSALSWSSNPPPALEVPLTPIEAVLVDRDGTLVRDVPYNGAPQLVEPLPGVDDALDRLRGAGLQVGVVTNQSGIARGLLTAEEVHAVNDRVEQLLGPFADWQICPHGEEDGCACRKPRPGMVLAAARALGVAVERCALIGDTGADVSAATSAGVGLAALVPNGVTRPEEIAAAPAVFGCLGDAVDAILERVPR
jgi:histidinol-phosphate phosphatase family protein